MLALVWVGGLLPTRLNQLSDKYRGLVLSLGNAFSGGVFLCVGLLHLLPEAAENMDKLNISLNEELPIVYLVALCGFLLIFFIEKILLNSGGSEEHRTVCRHM